MYSYRSNKLLLNNFNVGIRQWILKKENLNFAYFKKGVAVNLKNSRMGGSKLPANQTAPCVIHAKAWLFSIFVTFFTAWKLHFASSTENGSREKAYSKLYGQWQNQPPHPFVPWLKRLCHKIFDPFLFDPPTPTESLMNKKKSFHEIF